MLKFLGQLWRTNQRNVDYRILWPECKKQALTLTQARAVFLIHATSSPAWTKDFTEDEIINTVNRWS